MNRAITECPVCDGSLQVTELSCGACGTRLQGHFPPPPLGRLPAEHQRFVETFVRCRGVLRDMERELGVSYPTVRARLDAAVAALEAVLAGEAPAREHRRREILQQVAAGTLTALQAAEALRDL
jgi:hypothetical protein